MRYKEREMRRQKATQKKRLKKRFQREVSLDDKEGLEGSLGRDDL